MRKTLPLLLLLMPGVGAEAQTYETLYLRLTNASNVPSYFEVSKYGPLEDNGGRQGLGQVACSLNGAALTDKNDLVIPSKGSVTCVVDKLAAGNRVEVARTADGKTAIVKSFDLPRKKKFLKQYSFGTSAAPVSAAVDARTVKEMTADEATNNLKSMASSINFQAGFKPISSKQFNRFGGHFFVAKVDADGNPVDPNFNGAFDVAIKLDPLKDLPTAEFITPIRYANTFMTSVAAKATVEAKIPAIASINLGASANSLTRMSVTAKWFNFRIAKTLSEALSALGASDRAAIITQLAASADSRLFYVNGFTGVLSFEYNYKATAAASSANTVEFVYGGAAVTFDASTEQAGTATLDDQIVALSAQPLGDKAGVEALFTAVKPASVPLAPMLKPEVEDKIDTILQGLQK